MRRMAVHLLFPMSRIVRFIIGQLLKHRQINQTVNAFGDVNGLRHVEVDGGRQQQVHLLTWHFEHGGNHIDGVFDALR